MATAVVTDLEEAEETSLLASSQTVPSRTSPDLSNLARNSPTVLTTAIMVTAVETTVADLEKAVVLSNLAPLHDQTPVLTMEVTVHVEETDPTTTSLDRSTTPDPMSRTGAGPMRTDLTGLTRIDLTDPVSQTGVDLTRTALIVRTNQTVADRMRTDQTVLTSPSAAVVPMSHSEEVTDLVRASLTSVVTDPEKVVAVAEMVHRSLLLLHC